MRNIKRFCKNPIIVNNMAFPCMKCAICRKQVSHALNKALKKAIKPIEETINNEYIF